MTKLDSGGPPAALASRPWLDPSLTVAARVDAILLEMTLEEKVAQLGSRWEQGTLSSTDPVLRRTRRSMSRRCRTCSLPVTHSP